MAVRSRVRSMMSREDIHIFEGNLIERKKNLVFVPPGRQLFLPALQCQARETPSPRGLSHTSRSRATSWSQNPPSVKVVAAWAPALSSALSPSQARWPLSLKSLANHLRAEAHLPSRSRSFLPPRRIGFDQPARQSLPKAALCPLCKV